MVYTALPDRRIPYDNDGTQVGFGTMGSGITRWYSSGELVEMNDSDYVNVYDGNQGYAVIWMFYPEQREVTAGYWAWWYSTTWGPQDCLPQGSNDSGNGLDGSWEQASLPSGHPPAPGNDYYWRSHIKPISFTGPKRTFRLYQSTSYYGYSPRLVHLYGEKASGQTPDDVIYIDHDTTPGAEYTAPEDFGDQPLGTSVVRQFRLKNTSATKTANTINVQCNDSDFAISTDNATWVVTINITSLAAGAESATMYVRCTTPAVGNLLGPRAARIVTTVGSYT